MASFRLGASSRLSRASASRLLMMMVYKDAHYDDVTPPLASDAAR